MLTDEQCMKFRQMPGSFNEMVRAIYAAGQEAEQEACAMVADDALCWQDGEGNVCADHNGIATAIRARGGGE